MSCAIAYQISPVWPLMCAEYVVFVKWFRVGLKQSDELVKLCVSRNDDAWRNRSAKIVGVGAVPAAQPRGEEGAVPPPDIQWVSVGRTGR